MKPVEKLSDTIQTIALRGYPADEAVESAHRFSRSEDRR